jgi:outer membrane protein assembly factor BamB
MKRLSLALALGLFAASALAGDWLAWRGPLGTGVSDEQNLPLTWSAAENVKWKVPLEGPGNSTPIVVGKRVFITSSPAKSDLRGLLCFNREDGKQLWKRQVEYAEKEPTHNTNPPCASSPVSDGKLIFAWYGSAGLYCYDLEGKEHWHKDLGKVEHIWGYGSSPVLFEDLVILNVGPGLNSYVVALQKDSGEEVWRKEFPGQVSKKIEEFRGSWSTPVLHEENGQPVLLLTLPQRVCGINPRTGDELWNCSGLKDLAYASPLVAGEDVVAMGGYGGPALAVKAGKGDVTETNRLWLHNTKNPQRVGSGVVVGDYIYILNEPGVAWCLSAKTGEKQWEQRLGGTSSNWCSMIYADGRLYVPNRDGTTFVLEANPQACKVLAENVVGKQTTRGSLAVSDCQIFLRTHENLYCIEAAKQ